MKYFGKHTGLINYTIGQRKGLKIAHKEPLYVIELDAKKNQVIAGLEEELYKKELYANNINWLTFDIEKKIEIEKVEVYAKIRYRSKPSKAIVTKYKENICKVEFLEKQRAITKGQSVVFYDEDGVVLGGGIIM